MRQFEALRAIGQPLPRVDGPAKVSGRATYAADHTQDLVYAYAVTSTVAAGQVVSMDIKAAQAVPGVLTVLTPFNAPKLDTKALPTVPYEQAALEVLSPPLFVLQDREIRWFGALIGLVVAETFEAARYAASLVTAEYTEGHPKLDAKRHLDEAFVPETLLIPLPPEGGRGDVARGLEAATATVDHQYVTPDESHAQMEMGATVASWQDGKLTVQTTSQDVCGWQQSLCNTFHLPKEQVRVVSKYIGGGFGGKNGTWDHMPLAAMAAQVVGRPVKMVMTRQQMFSLHGHRQKHWQRIRLGAKADGALTAIDQEILVQTSLTRPFVEHTAETTGMIYACPNVHWRHQGVTTHTPLATIMRAPGSAPGMFALESAMDELAEALDMDAIELRRRNHATHDPENKKPWSSNSLLQCFEQGAERFGWSRRTPTPGSMRDGRWLVGMGMASATYPAQRMPCAARVVMQADGRVTVQLAATDIGTGTYTILTQVAADALGIPPAWVTVEMGDTDLPPTAGSGGSWGAASYSTAVLEAGQSLQTAILKLVRSDDASPLRGLDNAGVTATDGVLQSISDPGRSEPYSAILRRHGKESLTAEAQTQPTLASKLVSSHAFGAQFCEVRVDPDTGEVRVPRFVGAYGVGKLLNPHTARSQLLGGICWGLGMALTEEMVLDHRHGHYVNADLAEYHIPVCADLRDIEVLFVEEEDTMLTPLGAKGLGEIGIVGVAAAVANAVWHATGTRVRDLPITLDKMLAGLPE